MPEVDLIDLVARGMTEAEPRGDFRVRVIARLPDARPQPWWQLALLAGAGVAAGMLIMMGTSRWSHRSKTSAPAHTASVSSPRGATPVSSATAPGIVTVPRAVRPDQVQQRIASPGSAGLESPFPYLSIIPIQPGELSIAPIVVGPLVTGPLTVSPIEVRPGGRQK